MKVKGGVGSGVVACEEAFRRLVKGAPYVPEHVGIDPSKITAGIVSVEAGFDRGYLKKSRKSHLPLIYQIEAHRVDATSSKSARSPSVQAIKRAQSRMSVLEGELKLACEQRDIVLAQNLQLYERIRELEQELAQVQPRLGQTLRREAN
ncbi:hypothetical protein [Pseudomonas putida]|uniref:hypothetical protein n=1 Tax=Pseudomonas putida TaxID=303 RepID=UPI001E2E9D8A|nr:hypothetical protein [Pseudomonas putida]MCE0974751.1 hypothetical protein [Pseudomonas putida]